MEILHSGPHLACRAAAVSKPISQISLIYGRFFALSAELGCILYNITQRLITNGAKAREKETGGLQRDRGGSGRKDQKRGGKGGTGGKKQGVGVREDA